METEAKEVVMIWYKQGRYAFILGHKYEPPDNVVLRRAYCEGYQDELNGVWPEDDKVVATIFGL